MGGRWGSVGEDERPRSFEKRGGGWEVDRGAAWRGQRPTLFEEHGDGWLAVGGGVVGDMSPSTRFCVSEVAGGGDGVRDATLVLA